MKLLSLITIFMAALGAHAWAFTVNNKDNFCSQQRGYFSAKIDNNCYNLASEVEANVHSFSWCSTPWTRCSITMHDERGCNGKILGSATAAYLTIWEKTSVLAAGSKMRSFKVQGCKNPLPNLLPFDITLCHEGKQPWEEARWCA